MAPNRKTEPKSVPAEAAIREVALRVRALGARKVMVTDDFTKWAKDRIQLTPVAGGEWFTLLELTLGEYQYRLLIDGQWPDHSEAARRVDNPFGTQNCVLTVA